MILSLLYRLKPEECRLIMVDPKMLELSVYDGIPHLLSPVVTDPKKAVIALKWAVREMEERYKKMSKIAGANIDGYNARVSEAAARGEVLTPTVQTGFDRQTGEAIYEDEAMDLAPLPYIVIVVDEMADLMMVAGKDIEGAIQRLAQMARAGRHPPDHGHATPVGGRDHRHDQGELPDPDLLPGDQQDRLAHDPGRDGRRAAARSGRHAVHGRRRAHDPRARAVLLGQRGRERGRPPQAPGRPSYLDRRHRRRRGGRPREGRKGQGRAAELELDGAVFDQGSFGEAGGDLYDQAVQGFCATRRRRPATSSAASRSATNRARLPDGADGDRGHRRPGQPRRQARDPAGGGRAEPPLSRRPKVFTHLQTKRGPLSPPAGGGPHGLVVRAGRRRSRAAGEGGSGVRPAEPPLTLGCRPPRHDESDRGPSPRKRGEGLPRVEVQNPTKKNRPSCGTSPQGKRYARARLGNELACWAPAMVSGVSCSHVAQWRMWL